jgi:hypothetical protein
VSLRAAWRIGRREVLRALGREVKADTADRRLLEDVVLPHYAQRDDVRTVLLVGTRWYTRHYPGLLGATRAITLDIDPAAAVDGSPHRHLVGDVRDLATLLPEASLDAVIFNGVYGWGLDDAPGFERALEGIAAVLRAEGDLVFGWNDVARRRPFDWRDSTALARHFAPLPFGPLDGATHVALPTDNRHCFEFFARR